MKKIGFEKYASDPKILVKMYQNLTCQTKPSNFDTFWPISQDWMHIFQNRFVRSNHEIKPVVLSIMKPINKKTFFSPYKGAGGSLGGARGRSSRPRRELKFFGESYISMFNGKISLANSESKFGYFWPPLPVRLCVCGSERVQREWTKSLPSDGKEGLMSKLLLGGGSQSCS